MRKEDTLFLEIICDPLQNIKLGPNKHEDAKIYLLPIPPGKNVKCQETH